MKRICLLFLMMIILQGCNEESKEAKKPKEKKVIQKQKVAKKEDVKYTPEELRRNIERLAREYGHKEYGNGDGGYYTQDELRKKIEELSREYNIGSNDPKVDKAPVAQPKEPLQNVRKWTPLDNIVWNKPLKQTEPSAIEENDQNRVVPQKSKKQEKKIVEGMLSNEFTRKKYTPTKMTVKKPRMDKEENQEPQEKEHLPERIVKRGYLEQKRLEATEQKQQEQKQQKQKQQKQKQQEQKEPVPQPVKPPADGETKLAEDKEKEHHLLDEIQNFPPKKNVADEGPDLKEKNSDLLPKIKLNRHPNRPMTMEQLNQKYPESFVQRGHHAKKQIALTFDDGPDLTYTPQILDILKKRGVKATFFVIGERAESHPEIIKRIIREGHELGIHSYKHLYLPKLDSVSFGQQIQRTKEILLSLGVETKLFRPPFGSINEEQAEWVVKQRCKIVHWDVDSQDWKGGLGKREVESNVLSSVKQGSIILFHSAGGKGIELTGTIEALPGIIEVIKKRDMSFVKVSDLLK